MIEINLSWIWDDPWWKEPKIKASGLLLKRKSRIFPEDLAPWRFILFAPEIADFVGDLLRSFLQKSSISVRDQNPTIPRPEKDCELGFMNTGVMDIY